MRRATRRPSSPAELHRAWLELVDTDGPYLSVPALRRVWPQGMPPLGDDALAALQEAKRSWERAWERWDRDREDDGALERYRLERDLWVWTVLTEVFGWDDEYVADPGGTASWQRPARSPRGDVIVHADGALVRDGTVGALLLVVDPVDSLREPLPGAWAASPIDRLEDLLRAAEVPVGLVTDGRWWGLVSARPKTMVASGIVDAQTWIDEPQTRNAFAELVRPRRLVGGQPADRLTELFRESVTAAEEITEALGVQVRRAVELLVQALSEAALTARERGAPDPLPADLAVVYDAAVTLMMRVVFLLFAEERGLLPQGRLFALGYGISDELGHLDERLREPGGSVALDATYLTWHRLLATSQAVYAGASFEDIRLPSYGGSLFDPARFPFLTARAGHGALAVTISDLVMYEVLRAVQVAELRGQPAQAISFRDIDVEQIGYMYEGLLGYSCAEAKKLTVGLIGKSGEEPEITLDELEKLAEAKPTPGALADAILAYVAHNQPAAKPPTKSALAKALSAQPDDTERALRAVTTEEALRQRLRPFAGAIRRDLRNRPHVVRPGGVLVVETPSRATAGAHYTPRALAEEVVLHALQPLIYSPGPLEMADETKWVPISSDAILDLKVADIACGSGAFLVAAARYLAERLVEAWQRQEVAYGTPGAMRVRAIRKVVATCLYGADINAMAVEMCKLSLWLVSLDSKLPFSFVDDKVLHGNSLLGLTDARQLETLNINPTQASADRLFDLADDGEQMIRHLDVPGVLGRAVSLRRSLATEIDDADPQRSATAKRRQWQRYQELTAQLSDIADAIVAAGLRLGGKPGRALKEAYEDLRAAVGRAYPEDAQTADRSMLGGILRDGLTPTVSSDYERWRPLHWFLVVPDVMEHGGFDAIVGNPPFLGGQKLTSSLGTNIRDWSVNVLAGGQRGSADLVAYFFLRAATLLGRRGTLGLIATNTLAQGDTRTVGLDRLVKAGFIITRSIQSRSWPAASANLEFAAVWGTYGEVAGDVSRIADDMPSPSISTLLESVGRVGGNSIRLLENSGKAFIGCYVLGMGFVVSQKDAAEWIEADSRNAEVLFPYLNGEDLNSRPDCSPSRWVIDFNDRSEAAAMAYDQPFERVLKEVRYERSRKPKAVREAPWWLFLRSRPAMRRAVAGLGEVLVIARVSRTVMPVRVPTDQVFHEKVVVFATDSFGDQAALSSAFHQLWAIKYGTTMRIDPTYTPSTCFEPFPFPESMVRLHGHGVALDSERREMMLRRDLGLTKLYNLVNDPDLPDSSDPDVARLREIHVEIDEAVLAAYGWEDEVKLDHGFHTYRRMTRWSISPTARVEIFDRLLEENHLRAKDQGAAPPPVDVDDLGEGEE